MKYLSIYFLIAAIFLLSCKKDKEITEITVGVSNLDVAITDINPDRLIIKPGYSFDFNSDIINDISFYIGSQYGWGDQIMLSADITIESLNENALILVDQNNFPKIIKLWEYN